MSKNQPNFLKNQPIGEDQFEGKSQESMAEIISKSLEKSDYGIIGIDGSWGSGKSNLVSIIENKLSEKKYNFFIYDVWGHQEDEQRRTILEEITEYISKKKLVDQEKWNFKLKTLLAKNKETTTKKKPILSLGIILSVVSLLLLPLIKVLGESMHSNYKYFVYAIPFLILFTAYLYYFFKNFKKVGNVYLIAWNKLFEFYSKDKIEETTFVTITEDEPSVKKFRDWILEIDNDLVNKKIVVVFDNFDRLPKQKILGLWSSIHIFFAEQKYQNIKVIIPFDREHIKNAFGDLNHKNGEKEFGDYAEDYINKTFDIVYRVAPPILTNWKSFFEIKWNECFGDNYDNEEFRRTTQVYEIQNKKITPREIIVLINEIATLKQIHNSKIPAQYLALFVLNKTKILEDPVLEISKPTFIKGLEFIYLDDADLPKYITAIVYQLDPEKSLEIVFEQRLYSALIKKDEVELNKIADSNIFTSILESTYTKIADEFLPNSIESLYTVSSDKFMSEIRENLIWEDFIKRSYSLNNPDHNIKNFQKVILNKIINEEKQLLYVKQIISELSYDEKWDIINYAYNIDELQKYLTDQSIKIDVEENLEYHEIDNVDEFIALLETKKEDYEKYRINVDGTALDTKLEGKEVEKLEEIDYTIYLDRDNYKLPKFEKKLYSDFKSNFTNNELLPEILRLLKEFGKPVKSDALSDLNLHSRFTTVTEKDDLYYDFLAIRLSRDLSLSGYESYFSTAVNKIDDSYVEKVSKQILNYISFNDFILKYEIFKDIPLYKAILKLLIDDIGSKFGTYRLSIGKILPKIESISDNTDIDLEKLIKKFNSWSVSDLPFTTVKNFSNNFYQKAIEDKNSLTSKCIELKKEYFDSLTKENWKDIFSDTNSEDFKILKTIKYDNWSSISHEAFKENLVEKSSNISAADIDNHDGYLTLITSIESKNHKFKNTFEDVRDEFIKNNNSTINSFHFFGDLLFRYSNLKVDGAVRTIIKTELLDDKNSVDILIRNMKKLKLILEFSNDESQDFINSLVEKAKTNDLVNNLGEQLGLIKKTKNK